MDYNSFKTFCFQNGSKESDEVAMSRAEFMTVALLLRDTINAYEHGDGTRIFRNSKFEILLCSLKGHHKYKLWLWRQLAYQKVLLSPRAAYEYKWNCSSNVNGGHGKNIPNDNLVEINVKRVKQKLKAQGANLTFQSAQIAVESMQQVDDIFNSVQQQTSLSKPSGRKSLVYKVEDVTHMVEQLKKEPWKVVNGRKLSGNSKFKALFERFDFEKLHKWITDQKKILAFHHRQ